MMYYIFTRSRISFLVLASTCSATAIIVWDGQFRTVINVTSMPLACLSVCIPPKALTPYATSPLLLRVNCGQGFAPCMIVLQVRLDYRRVPVMRLTLSFSPLIPPFRSPLCALTIKCFFASTYSATAIHKTQLHYLSATADKPQS